MIAADWPGGTGAPAAAVCVTATDVGVIERADSPYVPRAPRSVTAHVAPSGIPSMRTVYAFAAVSATLAFAPRSTGTVPPRPVGTVHETSAANEVGAYCAPGPVIAFVIWIGPEARVTPALTGARENRAAPAGTPVTPCWFHAYWAVTGTVTGAPPACAPTGTLIVA